MKLQRQVNVAMEKVWNGNITVSMMSCNFTGTVKSSLENDQAYHFMSAIKNIPAYWKKCRSGFLAMIK